MASTLSLTTFWEDQTKPEIRGGSLTIPASISLTTGTPHYVEHTIADAFGQDVLWTSGEGGKDIYRLGVILVDLANQFVELRTDSVPEYFLFPLLKDVPFFLHVAALGFSNSATHLDGAQLTEVDTDSVDRIEGYNNTADGTGDAVFKMWLWD